MKKIPNILSVIRIFLPILLIIYPFTLLFYIIYIICGLTDVLDGYIARKYDCCTKLGAILDTIGDLIFYFVVFFIYFRIMEIKVWIVLIFCLIILVKLLGATIMYIKYKTFSFIHTYMNKITGLIIFVVLPLYVVINKYALIVMFSFAILSALEELLINIKSKENNLNTKSILKFNHK